MRRRRLGSSACSAHSSPASDTVPAARATDRCLDRLLREWPFALDPVNAPLYELSDEFAAIPATAVDRTTFGKWDAETDRALGHPGEIVLTGVTTDCCVLQPRWPRPTPAYTS